MTVSMKIGLAVLMGAAVGTAAAFLQQALGFHYAVIPGAVGGLAGGLTAMLFRSKPNA